MLALTRLNHAKHHEKLKKTQKNTKIKNNFCFLLRCSDTPVKSEDLVRLYSKMLTMNLVSTGQISRILK